MTSVLLRFLLLLLPFWGVNCLKAAPNACLSTSRGVCYCDLADGSGMAIDLGSLVAQTAIAPIKADLGQYHYLYVFCGVINDPNRPNCNGKSAVCEYATKFIYSMDIGRPASFHFEMRTSDRHASPAVALVADSDANTDGTLRRSIAFLNCDKSIEDVQFVSHGNSQTTDPDGYMIYYIDFTGSVFCSVPSKNAGALSAGSILLIIFFSLLGAYFIGGFLFLTFYQKRQGVERIPNYSFWLQLPGLAKEGALFTWNSGKQLCNKH